jgi:hypothetical protein
VECRDGKMTNAYLDKVMRISELGVTPKRLTPEAVTYLKDKIEKYMGTHDTNDIADVIDFIIFTVYNESYLCAVGDVLKILREQG